MFLNSMSSEKPASGADMMDLLAWFEVNKQKIAVATVALLGLVVVAMVVRHFQKEGQQAASAELLAVKTPWNAPTNTPPPAASEYVKVAANHAGKPTAARALVLAGGAYYAEGKYSEAETTFRKCVNEHAGHPLIPQAQYGIAASLEAQGKLDEAIAAYLNVSTTYGKSSAVADDAKLALARIYEARSQPEQALRLYNELAPQFDPEGGVTGGRGEAVGLKADLLKKHPELDTNRVTLNTSTQVVQPPAAAPAESPAPAVEAAPEPAQPATSPEP